MKYVIKQFIMRRNMHVSTALKVNIKQKRRVFKCLQNSKTEQDLKDKKTNCSKSLAPPLRTHEHYRWAAKHVISSAYYRQSILNCICWTTLTMAYTVQPGTVVQAHAGNNTQTLELELEQQHGA
jgi:hypothetical protein